MEFQVTVKVYLTIEEATLARDYLVDHGVDATIHVDETASAHPSASATTAIMVQVKPEDLEKAQELLQIT